MNQSTANEFYDRIVNGTEYEKEITLEHGSGHVLEGVRMSPVDKATLADVIQSLPSEMFEAVDEADDPEEAEQMLEKNDSTSSISAMSSETVSSFEELCKSSLSHPELTKSQVEHIIEALDFSVLFDLGGEIMDMSFAESGAIKDFRGQE